MGRCFKKIRSCCSSAVKKARFQHTFLHIVIFVIAMCLGIEHKEGPSCNLSPSAAAWLKQFAFKLQRSLLPSQHVTKARKQVRCVEGDFFNDCSFLSCFSAFNVFAMLCLFSPFLSSHSFFGDNVTTSMTWYLNVLVEFVPIAGHTNR